MLAPILHVGTETKVDIAEWRMTIVTRTTQQGILPINLFGKEYAISVERKKGILALIECLEVESIANTYRWSMVTVAPSNPIAVFNPCDAWVILILWFNHLCIPSFEDNRSFIDFPMNTVITEACKDVHLHSFVVATEHPCKAFSKWNDGTVEDTVRRWNVISMDNGVLTVTPHHVLTTLRTVFPRQNVF